MTQIFRVFTCKLWKVLLWPQLCYLHFETVENRRLLLYFIKKFSFVSCNKIWNFVFCSWLTPVNFKKSKQFLLVLFKHFSSVNYEEKNGLFLSSFYIPVNCESKESFFSHIYTFYTCIKWKKECLVRFHLKGLYL